MGNLYIWPLISQSDIVTINRLTLIVEFIGRCDIKHILMLQIKTIINSVHNITNITAHCIRLTAILVTMFVSTFKTDSILYLSLTIFFWRLLADVISIYRLHESLLSHPLLRLCEMVVCIVDSRVSSVSWLSGW